MDKIIRDALTDLGCSDKEIKFFITNYRSGALTINEIAKIAKIERSTAYLIAQSLISKGLIIEDLKQYKKSLVTIEPKTLLRMLSSKQRQIGRHELTLKENLGALESLYLTSEYRPTVRTYDGNNGLLSVWRDILSISQRDVPHGTSQEVLLWTNQETESNFFTRSYHHLFIKERLKKNIFVRVLAVNNLKGQELVKSDRQSLRKTKLLLKGINFSAETYIYGDKVAILDYNKDIIGVIIKSDQIAESQRSIFEMNWKML